MARATAFLRSRFTASRHAARHASERLRASPRDVVVRLSRLLWLTRLLWQARALWPAHTSRRTRVPIVHQQDAVECGAACLAMILGFFACHDSVPHTRHREARRLRRRPARATEYAQAALTRCRTTCDPGRDGLSAGQLADAARTFGLSTQAWVMEDCRAFLDSHTQLPAIAHWQHTHFVVVEHITPHDITIVDPIHGRQRLSHRAFDRECSGVVLTFAPGPEFESQRPPDTHTTWWPRLVADLTRQPIVSRLALLLLATTAALQLGGLVLPLLTQHLIDRVIPGQLTSPLLWLVAAGLLIATSQALLGYLRRRAAIHLHACFETHLTTHLLSHLIRLPLRFFQQRSSGDLLLRMSGPGTIRDLTTHALVVSLDALFVMGYLLLLTLWSPPFAALALTLFGLELAIVALSRRALHDVTHQHLAAQAETQASLVDVLRGIASIRAAGAEPHVLNRCAQLFARQLAFSDRRQLRAALFDSLLMDLRFCGALAALALGTHEVMAGHITLGAMLALTAIATAVLTPLGSLPAGLQQLTLARVQIERIRDILDTPADARLEADRDRPSVPLRHSSPSPGMALEVKRLAFRYHRFSPLVLDDISFTVPPGSAIAIVGRSGAGKSTLARLLAGLGEPTSGRVLLDGWPFGTLDASRARQRCGVVLEESAIFNLTIHENIAFGRPELTFEDVVRAARTVGLHDEIVRMPMAYDTSVLEGGNALSAGQRQLLLVARTIATRPALLVLDDTLSHLDAHTSACLAAGLRTMGCTRVLLTSRMTAVREADQVIVLANGRIVEHGPPAELLARRGHFAALMNSELETAGWSQLENTSCLSMSMTNAGSPH